MRFVCLLVFLSVWVELISLAASAHTNHQHTLPYNFIQLVVVVSLQTHHNLA